MFRMRLEALEHPNPSSVNAEDRKIFANTVLWLEDQVIRLYTVEDRADLRKIENIKLWETAYQRYKSDLCTPTFHSASEELFWLLSYGIRLAFLDTPEKFEDITASKVKQCEQIRKDVPNSAKNGVSVPVVSVEAANSSKNVSAEADTSRVTQTAQKVNKTFPKTIGTSDKDPGKTHSESGRIATNRVSVNPGGVFDPLKKGLSGAGLKWYRRFLAQGHTPKVARKMVDERRANQAKNQNEMTNFQNNDSYKGQFDHNQDSKSFLQVLEDCLKKDDESTAFNRTPRRKRAHSPKRTDAKRSKTSPSKDVILENDIHIKGLRGAGKKWYVRFIRSGYKPSEARQMVDQRRITPAPAENSNHTKSGKAPHEIELLVVDKGSGSGVISKQDWRKLKARLVKSFISLLKQFPGPIPAYRDAPRTVQNGRLVYCEDKRSAEMFQLAVLKLDALWPRAHIDVYPNPK